MVLVAGGNGCDCNAIHLHRAVLTVHQHISRTVQDGAWLHGEQLQLVVVVVLMGDEDDVRRLVITLTGIGVHIENPSVVCGDAVASVSLIEQFCHSFILPSSVYWGIKGFWPSLSVLPDPDRSDGPGQHRSFPAAFLPGCPRDWPPAWPHTGGGCPFPSCPGT